VANKEDILREKTYKGDVEELEQRVFYVLTDNVKKVEQQWTLHRTAKAVAHLVELLHAKKIISDDEVDELLFSLVHP